MAIDAVSLAAILKEVYPEGLPNEFLYKRSPFLALIRKDTEALQGELVKIPTNYGNPQGVGADFTQARANITDQLNAAFDLTHKNYYGFATITGESIDRSKTDRGSFIRVLTSTIEKTKYSMGRMMARYQLGNGSGVLGQISAGSTVGSAVITLANPSDARWFEVGMKLVAAASDAASGGSLRSSGATVTLTKVDRATGDLTASGNWTAGIAAVAAGDYLFRQGDWQTVISGYEAWVPRTAPSATTFFGVDRSVDSRLGGLRASFTDRSIIEGVQDALELLAREDSGADFGVLQSQDWMALSKMLQADGSLRTSMLESDTAGVGFKAIEVTGPSGTCKIISDPNMTKGRFFAGQLDTWCMYSMGEAIKLLDNDGNVTLRQGTADGVELQLVSRIQLGCEAPGWNGNFDIAGS